MLNRVSFQSKMFIFYSLFVLGILLFLAIVFYYYISSVLQKEGAKGMLNTVTKISSGLDSFVKEMDVISTQVMFNKDIQEIMAEAEAVDGANYFDAHPSATKRVVQALIAINSPKTIVNRIGIFNTQGSFVSAGKVRTDARTFQDNLDKADWLEDIQANVHKIAVLPPHPDIWLRPADSSLVITLIREFIDSLGSNRLVGYIEIQQPYAMVEELCRVDEASHMNVVVLDEYNRVVYPYDKLEAREVSDYYGVIAKEPGSEYRILSRPWDGTKELSLAVYSPSTRWTTILTLPEATFLSPVYLIQKILVVTGVVLMLITLVIMYLITRSLTAPIREMRKLVRNLSLGNLSIVPSGQTGNNEVALLGEVLTKSLNRLKESMEQTIQARAGQTHSHMLALQAQMNPHFLNNTLMAISGAALEAGASKVLEMCSLLSEMLQYTASFNDENVTLGDELRHTRNYLKLIGLRYDHFLEYRLEIDESLLAIPVPKLILQPLVENCFEHGFRSSTPPFVVEIDGERRDDAWRISVKDNGAGFGESDQIKLLQQLETYKSHVRTGNMYTSSKIGGMALANIYMRLQLLYGNNCIFEIGQAAQGGAEVVIGGALSS